MNLKAIAFLIGLIASIITIYVFLSGNESVDKIGEEKENNLQKQAVNIQTIANKNSYTTEVNKNSIETPKSTSNEEVHLESKLNILPLGNKLYLVKGNSKNLIFTGFVVESYLTPDKQKVIVIGNSRITLLDSNGEKTRSYDLNYIGTNINRNIKNVIVLSNRQFRAFIELGEDEECSLGDVKLYGYGEYLFTFDKYNYFTSIKKIRN